MHPEPRLKITEIPQDRFRTRYIKNGDGKRIRKTIPYIGVRDVLLISPPKRLLHFAIDYVLLLLAFMGFIVLTQYQTTSNFSIVLNGNPITIFPYHEIGLLLYMIYYFVCEGFLQRTVGKVFTKSVVINEYGKDITPLEALMRTFIRLLPFEALSCIGDLGWHDKWSKTYVVSTEERAALRKAISECEFVEGKWKKKEAI